MNPLAAATAGLPGSACIVGAYGYNVAARRINALFYNLANLLGAGLLILSLSVHCNPAALLPEIVWSGVALLGIASALRRTDKMRKKDKS